MANLLRTFFYYLYLAILFLTTPFFFFLIKIFLPKSQGRRLIFHYQHLSMVFLFAITKIPICVHGREHLKKKTDTNKEPSYLIMSNHLSSFDIFAILAAFPFPVIFLSKPLYFFIPFVSITMRMVGHISINRTNPKKALMAVRKAAFKMTQGISVAVFPEGTRSKDGQVHSFNSSPLSVLKNMPDASVLPVTLLGTDKILKKNNFMLRGSKIDITIDKPIDNIAEQLKKGEKQKLIKKIEDTIRHRHQEVCKKNTR